VFHIAHNSIFAHQPPPPFLKRNFSSWLIPCGVTPYFAATFRGLSLMLMFVYFVAKFLALHTWLCQMAVLVLVVTVPTAAGPF
jgi:hypothetical protein